jgi:hypothetical protein
MPGIRPTPILQRLMSKRLINPVTGCWEWQGTRTPQGYGKINYQGKMWLTHRLAFHLFVGPLLPDHYICHRCDNRPCFSPDDLFQGTSQENSHDAVRKGHLLIITRLTASDILQVRKLRQEGVTITAIATLTGISISHVHRIIHDECWKHLVSP